jgi:uncharacterized membrane protein
MTDLMLERQPTILTRILTLMKFATLGLFKETSYFVVFKKFAKTLGLCSANDNKT